MALWRGIVEKYYAGANKYWVNTYWVNEATLGAALTTLSSIATAERPLYVSAMTITKIRVDDGQPNTDVFATGVLNLAGTRGSPGGDIQPPWYTARVDFQAAEGGRPSRKYLRNVLFESDSSATSIAAGMTTLLQTYATAVAATTYCDVDGSDIQSGTPWTAPQMRQEHRKKKKPITP